MTGSASGDYFFRNVVGCLGKKVFRVAGGFFKLKWKKFKYI